MIIISCFKHQNKIWVDCATEGVFHILQYKVKYREAPDKDRNITFNRVEHEMQRLGTRISISYFTA